MEDGSETLMREEMAQLSARQEKFVKNLENALRRIENKSFGVCRVTGKLIQKARLRLVPHATLSIEAKKRSRIIINHIFRFYLAILNQLNEDSPYYYFFCTFY